MLRNQGLLFQLNLGSLAGMYSGQVRSTAIKMIRSGYIDFIGTDLHNRTQIKFIQKAMNGKDYARLHNLPVLNNKL